MAIIEYDDSFTKFTKMSKSFLDINLTLEDLKNNAIIDKDGNYLDNDDYKSRLIIEFAELFIRARNLHKFIVDIKNYNVDTVSLDCSVFILEKQLDTMVEYLKILEIRCTSSNINLLLFKSKDKKAKSRKKYNLTKKVLRILAPDSEYKDLTKDDFKNYNATSMEDFKSQIKNDPDLKYVYMPFIDGKVFSLVWKCNGHLVDFPFTPEYIADYFGK